MIRDSFEAMGTTVIVAAENAMGITATKRLFGEVERVCSRFDATSELSRLNDQRSERVEVSPTLAAVLAAAKQARRVTSGLVDAAVGAAVSDWGYDRTLAEVTDLTAAPEARRAPEWDIAGHTVTRPPGTRLDLGGIAKGWTCDRAVESGFVTLASAGGDLRSATPSGIAEVIDPVHGGIAARIEVGVGALATSSRARRRWRVGDGTAHHIIDPRTGAPAVTPIVSATVTAPTAAEAEAGAKAVLLLGVDGLAWADSQPWIGGAMACWESGEVYATGSLQLAETTEADRMEMSTP